MSDLISRQAVYEVLNQLYDNDCFAESERDIGWNNAIANMKLEIAELPSVQQEPKTGMWTIEDVHSATYKYCCSECKAHHRARYDFCPTCGAKMGDE